MQEVQKMLSSDYVKRTTGGSKIPAAARILQTDFELTVNDVYTDIFDEPVTLNLPFKALVLMNWNIHVAGSFTDYGAPSIDGEAQTAHEAYLGYDSLVSYNTVSAFAVLPGIRSFNLAYKTASQPDTVLAFYTRFSVVAYPLGTHDLVDDTLI